MADHWIIDVLVDLHEFAARNGLAATGRQLELAMQVVGDELASVQGLAQGTARRGIAHAGSIHRTPAGGSHS